MFLSTSSVIILGFGSVFAFIYIVLLICSSKKYKDLTNVLEEKKFPLHDLYGIGFLILDLIHYRYNSRKEIDRKRDVEIVYGNKYADFYLSVIAAQRITISLTIAVIGFALFGMANDITILMVMLAFAAVGYYYYATNTAAIIRKRSDELLRQFPDIVSKLALLINAGMIMKEAWYKIAENGDGLIYEEMRKAVVDMENGTSEFDAYYDFGVRCVIPEIKKFTSTMLQGLVKGNQEFAIMIKEQNREIWDIKQNHVRQQGEKAASKLLIPICLMFVGILIMVIVPIFTNLGV